MSLRSVLSTSVHRAAFAAGLSVAAGYAVAEFAPPWEAGRTVVAETNRNVATALRPYSEDSRPITTPLEPPHSHSMCSHRCRHPRDHR